MNQLSYDPQCSFMLDTFIRCPNPSEFEVKIKDSLYNYVYCCSEHLALINDDDIIEVLSIRKDPSES